MEIKPYEKNAKEHPKEQVELIARSIARFGWRQPIIVNGEGVIVVGHGRWEAYNQYKDELNLAEAWIVNDEGETISGQAEVLPFIDEEERAYRLADNQINALSGNNMVLVKEELKLLDPELLELTGFSADLIIEPDDKDDATPPLPEVAKSKIGDVYELGRHRLICGDSTDPDVVAKLMGGRKADMVFTDPPYNVNYSGRGENTSNKIMNDSMSSESFDLFLAEIFKRYNENSKSGAGWYVFHSSSTQHQFQKAIENAGWKVKAQIIWNKPTASMGWGDYRWKHEPMFYCGKENTQFYGDRKHHTVIDIPKDDMKALKWLRKQKELERTGHTTIFTMKKEPVGDYVHPTQKPVELITYTIANSSKEDDIIMDLFGGSGSTMIAAEKMGRNCYACELDEKYVDVMVQRYVEYIGNGEPVEIIKNGEKIIW